MSLCASPARYLRAWFCPTCGLDSLRVGCHVQAPGPWGTSNQRSTPAPSCHSPPQAYWNFLGCPPSSVIMMSCHATLSMSSFVRCSQDLSHASAGGPDHIVCFCQCRRQLRAPGWPNSAIRFHMSTGADCSGKSPLHGPRWRGLASCAVQLCPSLGPMSPHLCTQLSIPRMGPPWGPSVQSAPPPRFRLIEKMDGESQFRMISLGWGVGEA